MSDSRHDRFNEIDVDDNPDEYYPDGDEGYEDDYDDDGHILGDYEDDLIDGVGFADPGGESALRAATKDNPRDRPCPTCGRENVLTRIDEMRHYQCDHCARQQEMGY